MKLLITHGAYKSMAGWSQVGDIIDVPDSEWASMDKTCFKAIESIKMTSKQIATMTAKDMTAKDMTAKDVTAKDVTAKDVTAKDVTAKDGG